MHYHSDKYREYWQCQQCQLVFVPPEFYLSAELEKKEYEKHLNDVYEQGYRTFLGRIFEPVQQKLTLRAKVLDFGCGPGPALATMFKEAGFDVSIYDAFFAPDTSVLKLAYFDAITTTEVVEHLHHPAEIFDNLVSYLAPHGVLGIMTKTVIDAERFANWHYKNDQTHVCFYSAATFDYLAEKYSMRWEAVANDAFIFSRLTDDV